MLSAQISPVAPSSPHQHPGLPPLGGGSPGGRAGGAPALAPAPALDEATLLAVRQQMGTPDMSVTHKGWEALPTQVGMPRWSWVHLCALVVGTCEHVS
jgi:hypothetical protein